MLFRSKFSKEDGKDSVSTEGYNSAEKQVEKKEKMFDVLVISPADKTEAGVAAQMKWAKEAGIKACFKEIDLNCLKFGSDNEKIWYAEEVRVPEIKAVLPGKKIVFLIKLHENAELIQKYLLPLLPGAEIVEKDIFLSQAEEQQRNSEMLRQASLEHQAHRKGLN